MQYSTEKKENDVNWGKPLHNNHMESLLSATIDAIYLGLNKLSS